MADEPGPREDVSDAVSEAVAAAAVGQAADAPDDSRVDVHVGGLERPWCTPLTEDGFLPVRVFALAESGDWTMVSDAAVVVSRKGIVVGVGKAATGGIAQIPGLGVGVHSVLAFSAEGIAAVGVCVSNEPGEFQPGRSRTVDVPLVPASNVPLVAELLRGARNVQPSGPGVIVPEEDLRGLDRAGEPVFMRGPDGAIQGRVASFGVDHVRALSGAD
ncbi:MAG: hypothetical protein ACF8TS_20785, partial [Maioricimonas sp. JB049]